MSCLQRTLLRLITLLCLSAVTAMAVAWDTLVTVDKQGVATWNSIYQKHPPFVGVAEHTKLSDMALRNIGLEKLFGRFGTANMALVDLNASLFRREEMASLPTEGDDEDTAVEERLVPPPASFSGLPDFSYSVFDWINKNQYCPAAPASENKLCHTFANGWLGNLNSVHFGSQAQRMYESFHLVALLQARRTHTLHEKIRRAGKEERNAHKDLVREGELMALAYEGMAQHFLQDRWAIGHMWERWNGGDFNRIDNTNLIANSMVSTVAGLLHGSESVVSPLNQSIYESKYRRLYSFLPQLNTADPMSSPLIDDKGTLSVMTWRHINKKSANRKPLPGIGDERLADSIDNRFGAPYAPNFKDYDLDVSLQMKELLECSAAGWSEVIRAFGKYGNAYGAWEAPLATDAPNFEVIKRAACWDQWATNESIYYGLANDRYLPIAMLGRLAAFFPLSAEAAALAQGAELGRATIARRAMVHMGWAITRAYESDPYGTDLATGDIGAFMEFDTGNNYALPNYPEPPFIDELPDKAEDGRDKQTVHGLFNRSSARHWCTKLPDLLSKLRGSDKSRDQELCRYLVDFSYEGTDKEYAGSQKERRQYKDTDIKPICTILDKIAHPYSETFPRWIDQGYVPYETSATKPDKEPAFGRPSTANWCNKLPVLSLAKDKQLRDENIVAEVNADAGVIDLTGANLATPLASTTNPQVFAINSTGERKTLKVVEDSGEIYPSQHTIKVDISQSELNEGDWRLEVISSPNEKGKTRKSAGLFKLRINPDIKIKIVRENLDGVGPCRKPLPQNLPLVDFRASIPTWKQLDINALEKLLEETTPFVKQSVAFLEREAACIKDLENKTDQVMKSYDWDVLLPSVSRYEEIIEGRFLREDALIHFPSARPDSLLPDIYHYHHQALLEATLAVQQLLTSIERILDIHQGKRLALATLEDNGDPLLEEQKNADGIPLSISKTRITYPLGADVRKDHDAIRQIRFKSMAQETEAVINLKSLLADANNKGRPSIERLLEIKTKISESATIEDYDELLVMYQTMNAYMPYINNGLNRWVRIENKFREQVAPKLIEFSEYYVSLNEHIYNLMAPYEKEAMEIDRRLEDGEMTEPEYQSFQTRSSLFLKRMDAEYGECTSSWYDLAATPLKMAFALVRHSPQFSSPYGYISTPVTLLPVSESAPDSWVSPQRYYDYNMSPFDHQVGNRVFEQTKCSYLNNYIATANSVFSFEYLYGDVEVPDERNRFREIMHTETDQTPPAKTRHAHSIARVKLPQPNWEVGPYLPSWKQYKGKPPCRWCNKYDQIITDYDQTIQGQMNILSSYSKLRPGAEDAIGYLQNRRETRIQERETCKMQCESE